MYDTIFKGLERFAGSAIRFDAVTPDWLRKYDRFLLDEGKSCATNPISDIGSDACFNQGPVYDPDEAETECERTVRKNKNRGRSM